MKISVLIATYNPNIDWLYKQFYSIKNQTYKDLEVIVLDDSSNNVDSVSCIAGEFGFTFFKNDINLGSNKTFEKLTAMATGDFLAFCDQDDIWHSDKLSVLIDAIKSAPLIYSDVNVIDELGNILAGSITKIRKRHILKSGNNITGELIFSNPVIGCTMLIRADIAKDAIPFAVNLVHDHYLAIIASTYGEIVLIDKPLIDYRIHSSNQTSVFSGIDTKEDYYNKKLLKPKKALQEIKNKVDVCAQIDIINDRINLYNGDLKKSYSVLKNNNKSVALFEVILMRCPKFIWNFAIRLIKKGLI